MIEIVIAQPGCRVLFDVGLLELANKDTECSVKFQS